MTEEAPVVVVGAGPIGMTSALALNARGVPSVILEQDPEDRERPGSRAIYIHGSTLRVWERIHPTLGTRVVDDGLVWPTRRTLYSGKEVFSRTYSTPGGTGDIPHFSSIPQVWTEDHLLDALDEADIPIHWETSVETVDSTEEGVTVEAEDGRTWEAEYVIGADGGGSQVRKEIGSSFEGDKSKNAYIITDLDKLENDPLPEERIFHYNDPDAGGRNVLLVPFASGWRLDIQCREDEDPEVLSSDERMRKFVRDIMGPEYEDRITWVSTYYFLQVIADSFIDEHRRVLLAGEAAHLLAPFGARGMNSGVADADEAASSIAVALQAETEAVRRDEIELFAARREKAAKFNVHAAGQALHHLRGDSFENRVKKRLAALAAPYYEPAGEWLDDAPYGPHEAPPIVSTTEY